MSFDIGALQADVAEIGRNHARIGYGLNHVVVDARPVDETAVVADAIGLEGRSGNHTNAAGQVHFVLEGLTAATLRRPAALVTGPIQVEMRGVHLAVLARGHVLGEEYEDGGIGSWLAWQNDSQSGRCIFFDALEADARGGINYGEVR